MTEKALELYMGNPYWREYYEKAPSENCRRRIETGFCYSAFRKPENIREVLDALEEKLDLEDWKHLAKYAGNNPWGGKCRKKVREFAARDGAEQRDGTVRN